MRYARVSCNSCTNYSNLQNTVNDLSYGSMITVSHSWLTQQFCDHFESVHIVFRVLMI